MNRIIVYGLAFAIALVIGVAATIPIERRAPTETDNRSCQVKQIGSDGHATWMTCSEWKARQNS